jgi:ABC-type Na+ efflux pump permease subunit
MRLTKNVGLLLLGLWLIITGLVALVPSLNVAGMNLILAVLALVAGIFILLGR